MTKPEIKCRTLPELKAELQDMGEKPFRAGQIFQWLHQGVQSFDEMTNISKPLRAKLAEHYLLGEKKLSEIRGISWREEGIIYQNPWRDVLDLDRIPFAYQDLREFENRIIYYESTGEVI